MKKFLSLLLAAVATTAFAEPQLPIDKAIKIATGYLKENGRDGSFITSITLEPTTMASGPSVWAVKWNAPVVLSDTKRETGLEIAMDGSYARYTEKLANANSPSTIGVPADRSELSNHRTRSTRPSILDLKH
jgi:hypothetical protein